MSAQRTTWQKIARRIRVPLGFVCAAIFLYLAHPSLGTLLASIPVVGSGLWLRGYAAGYVKKNAELTQTGPYAHTRNPLYLGSILIAVGFAVAARSWPMAVVLVAMFLAIYLPTIHSEEQFLREAFPEFDAYASRVPRLLPRLTPAKTSASKGSFSPELYRKHREYNALMGSSAIYAALIARLIFWPR